MLMLICSPSHFETDPSVTRNCLVIITTSAGQESVGYSLLDGEERQHFLKEIQTSFPVEFLARIDELIVFVCLSLAFAI